MTPSTGTSQHQATDHEFLSRYEKAITGVFGTPSRVLVKGEGVTVWDADGNSYTDLLGGIAVNAVGHAHPRLVDALSDQVATLGHISNLFTSPTQVGLAEKLLELAGCTPGAGSVFFSNSGSEANEAAIKLARGYGKKLDPQRTKILALSGSFHGRTMGAVSLTEKPAYRDPFAPLVPEIEHVPANDVDAMRTALAAGDVAAVIIEPVQGESGVHGFDAGYLPAVRELTRENGALLIFDEIQSGVGRTGTWFAFQNPVVTGSESPVVPDIMTLAKGLGGGTPIGATVSFTSDVSETLTAGQHGTTFGGNPLATRAGLTVLNIIEDEGLLAQSRLIGDYLRDGLAAQDGVREVRAYGAWVGVDLEEPVAKAFVTAALDAGFIVNATGDSTLRLAPALITTTADLAAFLAAFADILSNATR